MPKKLQNQHYLEEELATPIKGQKMFIHLDLAISLLGIYPKKTVIVLQKIYLKNIHCINIY